MEITAVIPAYNEEETIGEIVEVVKDNNLINKVIVVSDGSKDDTVKVADEAGAEVIQLKNNRGKGAAMQVGINYMSSDIILFLDADLIGLQLKHIDDLLLPVISNEVEMTVGIFSKGRLATDLAQKIAPFLSGQRAVKSNILKSISHLDLTRFGVEVALTRYVKENNIKIKSIELDDLTHVLKEEKFGLIQGLKERLKMYWDILKCSLKRKMVD